MESESDRVQSIMANHPILKRYGAAEGPEIVNLGLVSFICHGCGGIYCPIGSAGRAHPELRHAMDLAMLEQVLSDLMAFPRHPVLRLLPPGELAEYPQIADAAELLAPYAHSFPIVANTNGRLLPRLEPLLPSLTILEVSINAVNRSQYEALRSDASPGDFDRVVEGSRAIAARIRHGGLHLKLVVSFLRYPGVNDDSWEDFKTTWAALGAEPILRELHSFSNQAPRVAHRAVPPSLPPCKSLFTRMTLTSAGAFIRCYNDIFATDIIGTLAAVGCVQSLWYSERNLEGMLIMLGERPGRIFCSDCTDRVCADPRTGVGIGRPFEYHARMHHASIRRLSREDAEHA